MLDWRGRLRQPLGGLGGACVRHRGGGPFGDCHAWLVRYVNRAWSSLTLVLPALTPSTPADADAVVEDKAKV